MVVDSIILAGIETTLSTILWFFVYMLHYPEYQNKMFEEIQSNVGLDRPVVYKDMESLPFVQAVILETHRFATVSTLALPHKTMKDTWVAGKAIPKDTTIFFNTYALHYSDKYWENPKEFKPERWLNTDGSLKPTKGTAFMVFSLGPRNCIGEKLATMNLFLMTARTIASFQLLPDPNAPFPSLEDKPGFTRQPKDDVNIIFKQRSHVEFEL